MAAVSGVPVVNLLSDDAHPLQALADLLTLRQHWGSLEGRTPGLGGRLQQRGPLAGARRGAVPGSSVRVAAPAGYGPSEADVERVAGSGAT